MANKHPLPRGTRVVTVAEIIDQDADDEERITPPDTAGTITGMAKERDNGDPGFCYDVELTNGVWLTVDDDEIDDEERFRVLGPPSTRN